MNRIKVYKTRLEQVATLTVADRRVGDASAAASILMKLMAGLACEEVWVLFVNARMHVVGAECVARGGMSGCSFSPADIIRPVLLAGARGFIVSHNHPSGDPTPSIEDALATKHLEEACKVVGIDLLDHIVVCPEVGKFSSVEFDR